MEEMETKRARCKFSFISFEPPRDGRECSYDCHRNGLCDIERNVTEKQCEQCQSFKSRYIEYPITVNSIEVKEFEYNTALGHKVGEIVRIRPCSKKYQGKTFIGIFLGDMPLSPSISFNEKTQELTVRPMYNPAIFVPEINKVIFGAESWWGTIKDENDIEITDETINGQWYMQMLKSMTDKRKGEENAGK